jgi:hypothetical protein
MPAITYRNRRAYQLANDKVSITVTQEGGHLASILHREAGVNPLWTPAWPSVEPSEYSPSRHPGFGTDAEAKLLAGIFGHNLCLDLFGGPSDQEAAAGMTVHGESSVAPYVITEQPGVLIQNAIFPQAQLRFERRLSLSPASELVRITETVENLTAWDRPSAWTQHVTLGVPFIEPGVTQFRTPGTRSKVYEIDFAEGKGLQRIGAEFDWPYCPRKDGKGHIDLRVYPTDPVSAGYTATLMDPHREQAFFLALNPKLRLLAGYVWKRSDFPWLGRWEENRSRENSPWNGKEITCGMEFGASPMPETRRQMIERGSLFGVPGYRWLPARTPVTVEYCAFVTRRESIPESVDWSPGTLRFHDA